MKTRNNAPLRASPKRSAPSGVSQTERLVREVAEEILPTLVKEVVDTVVKQMTEALTREFNGQNQALLDQLKEVQAQHAAELTAVKERCQADVEVLRNQVSALQHAVERGERVGRQANLIVYGAPEETQGATVAATVANLLGSRDGLLEVRRLGRPATNGAGSKPRPILVRCAAGEVKHNAFKRSQELRTRKIYLEDDLTPAQLETRAKKRDWFLHYKSHDAKPFWRQERLFYHTGQGEVREHTGPSPPNTGRRPGAAPPPPPHAPPPHASA